MWLEHKVQDGKAEWKVYAEIAKETDVKNRLLDYAGEGKGGWCESIALKHVYYHILNRWPVQLQCMKQSTQSQCSGTTRRGWWGRVVGGEFSMGQ